MKILTHTLVIRLTGLCITLLLYACSSNSVKQPPHGDDTTPVKVSSSLASQFENSLATKLLDAAEKALTEAEPDQIAALIDTHHSIIVRSVDTRPLSLKNYSRVLLLDYAWRQNHMTADEHALQNRFSSGVSSKDIDNQAMLKLQSLNKEIRLINQLPVGADLTQLFESTRNNPKNYFPENETGKQAYLSKFIDDLGKAQMLIPLFTHSEIQDTLEISDFDATPNSYLQYVDNTIRVDLQSLTALPIYEIESAALYYGVPGLHALPNSPLQRIINSRDTAKGWAAYVLWVAGGLPAYQHPNSVLDRAYVESFLILMARVDHQMMAGAWSKNQAITYMMKHSPYPIARINKAVDKAITQPSSYLKPFLVELQIENLRLISKQALGEKFDLSTFHDLIINAYPLPIKEMHSLVERWIEQQQYNH